MHDFTPIPALVGGVLIGLSASSLLLFHGRVAGISGIVGGVLRPKPGEVGWRLMFVLGLVVGGVVIFALRPAAFAMTLPRSPAALAAAGLLVGFGTRLGSGCTSGHGVCGISRLSTRSIVATVTFIATGALVVLAINRLFGGAL